MKRTIIAFAVAPLIPAAVLGASGGFFDLLPYTYVFSYILGLPVFLILKTRKKERHMIYGLSGLLMGSLYVLAPALVSFNLGDPNALLSAFIFGVIGAVVALTFSLIRGDERNTA